MRFKVLDDPVPEGVLPPGKVDEVGHRKRIVLDRADRAYVQPIGSFHFWAGVGGGGAGYAAGGLLRR